MSGEPNLRFVRWRGFVIAGTMLVLACNQRHPIQEHAIVPSQPSTVLPAPAPIPSRTSTLSALTLAPVGMLGGNVGRGTVLLTLPAPIGGTVVTLSTSDPGVAIPPSVTVADGRDSTDFLVTTQAVGADRQATITASVPERSVNTSLLLWTLEPTFLAFANDPSTDAGLHAARHVTVSSATFTAFCSGNEVLIQIREGTRDGWVATFTAPESRPLRVGTYDLASSRVFLAGTGIGCSQGFSGQFTVREANYTASGAINRFWAAFDLRCGITGPGTRGDVRLTDVGTGNLASSPTCNLP